MPARPGRLFAWVFVLSTAALVPALQAQISSGQISGFARDATGAVVPSVRVTAGNAPIGLSRNATTNESGYYTLTNLPAGTYQVTGELSGFMTFIESGIRLDPGAAITIDLRLNVGGVSEKVEVTAAAQTVTTDTAQVGRLVSRDQLQELPVSGRSFINLVGLQAGVAVAGGSFNSFNYNPSGLYSWHVNGTPAYTDLWQLDGVVNNRSRNNMQLNGVVSVDAVQEVQIVTSGFKAEYGRNSGAQINFITKSGTQAFHGAAYEYLRNDALDARGFFSPKKEHLRWNNFGWNIGGPVYIPKKWNTDKSRLFFFFSQEFHRYRAGTTVVQYVPPAELRAGNFNTPYRLASAAVPIDPLNGLPFPGNILPAERLSPTGLALAKVFPNPTSPNVYVGNNRFAELLARNNTLLHTIRVDYNRWNSRFSVRLNRIGYGSEVPAADVALNAYYLDEQPKEGATFQVTTMVSPTMVNEFVFGVAADIVTLTDHGPGYLKSSYGINFPYFYNAKLVQDKLPDVSVAGIGSFTGRSYPTHSSGPIYQWKDNLTKVLQGHTLKGGIFIENSQMNDFDMVSGRSQNGIFTFSATPSNPATTRNAMADMLLGRYDTYVEIGQRAYVPWRTTLIEWFVQDSWKARSDLTLEYGLRWSMMPPFHSPYNNFMNFDPRYYDRSKAVTLLSNGLIVANSGDPYNGMTLPGSGWPDAARGRVAFADDPASAQLFHNLPETFTELHQLWAPRLGFAWDVGGRHRTTIRGGAALFYDFQLKDDYLQPGGKPPLQPQVNISNGVVDNPGGSAAVPIYPLEGARIDPVAKNPVSYHKSFGVQHAITPNLALDVTYVGVQGRHLPAGQNLNQPALGTSFANPGKALDSLRPFPGWTSIHFMEYAYNSNYNALQATVTRRLAKGLQFGLAYTLSKAMIDAESYSQEAVVNTNPHLFRYARASYDRKHMLNISYIYQLPFFRNQRGALAQILGGWEISGLTLFQSGQPTDITVSGDPSGAGMGARPVWVSNPNLPKDERSVARYFDTSAVTRPANGTWGNLGRNVVVGPGINNWDVAFLKAFSLRENVRLQFRSELFNVFNHPQFTGMSTTLGSGNFGFVTTAAAPRIIQFGLRLGF